MNFGRLPFHARLDDILGGVRVNASEDIRSAYRKRSAIEATAASSVPLPSLGGGAREEVTIYILLIYVLKYLVSVR